MNTIKSINFYKKVILVRIDINIPMDKKIPRDLSKIKKIKKTLLFLMKQNAKIILISHFGRPKKYLSITATNQQLKLPNEIANISLEKILPYLSKTLKVKIKFAKCCIGEIAKKAIKKLKYGEIILLENLRFFHEEEKCDMHFAKMLANLADIYINEAFSCSHRKHASIIGICNFLPSYFGIEFVKEVKILNDFNIFTNNKHTMLIIGGNKINTKLKVLEKIIHKFKNIFIAGTIINNFLKKTKNNNTEKILINNTYKIIKRISKNLITPLDFIVKTSNKKIEISSIKDDILKDSTIVDIGPQSLIKLCHSMKKMKQILWNGPLGIFENPYFDNSTKFIARYIVSLTKYNNITSIAGGGETASAIKSTGLSNKFSYISTAGGAFLEFLGNNTLPGISAIEKQK